MVICKLFYWLDSSTSLPEGLLVWVVRVITDELRWSPGGRAWLEGGGNGCDSLRTSHLSWILHLFHFLGPMSWVAFPYHGCHHIFSLDTADKGLSEMPGPQSFNKQLFFLFWVGVPYIFSSDEKSWLREYLWQ